MPPGAAGPAPRGTHAARVSELEGELRGLRRKVAELSESLARVEEDRQRLRETLDGALHQVELQTLTIEELRLELEGAHAKLVGSAPPRGGGPPGAPPRALDARALTLQDLLPLAQGAGERLKALQRQGVTVDIELQVLRQAIEFLKAEKFWEAQVVLHGLRVALESRHRPRSGGPHAHSEDEEPRAPPAAPAAAPAVETPTPSPAPATHSKEPHHRTRRTRS
jgi:hypothetical protein